VYIARIDSSIGIVMRGREGISFLIPIYVNVLNDTLVPRLHENWDWLRDEAISI
jgi:hypothetical protein